MMEESSKERKELHSQKQTKRTENNDTKRGQKKRRLQKSMREKTRRKIPKKINK